MFVYVHIDFFATAQLIMLKKRTTCHVNADSEGRGDSNVERVLGAEMSVACELGMLEPSATHNCLDRLV